MSLTKSGWQSDIVWLEVTAPFDLDPYHTASGQSYDESLRVNVSVTFSCSVQTGKGRVSKLRIPRMVPMLCDKSSDGVSCYPQTRYSQVRLLDELYSVGECVFLLPEAFSVRPRQSWAKQKGKQQLDLSQVGSLLVG